MHMKHSTLIVCVFVVSQVGGVTKTWIPNTNYDNPNNWNRNRVPCPADRIVFPSRLNSAVQFPDGSTMVKEMVLPTDGEIILPRTGSLVVTGDSKEYHPTTDCRGEDITFSRNWVAQWLDPANWETEGVRPQQPVPHVERVPCNGDRVVFPEKSSFRLRLPRMRIALQSFTLWGQVLNHFDWNKVLSTDTGARQFTGDPENFLVSLNNQERRCSLNDECCAASLEMRELVCLYTNVHAEECRISCASPIQPHGHCCPICGAYVMMTIRQGTNLNINDMRKVMGSYLDQEKYRNVEGYISEPSVGKLGRNETIFAQAIFVEVGEYNGISRDLTKEFAETIKSDSHFDVVDLQMYMAGERLSLSTWGSILGIIFGTFIAVLVVMGLIYFVFIGYQEKGWVLPAKPFVFARFENTPSESEEAVESRVEVLSVEPRMQEQPGSSHPKTAAFDNPMYGKTKVEERPTLPPVKPGHQVTHENPVYSELKRREEQMKEEDEKVDIEEVPLTIQEEDDVNLDDAE